MPQDALLKDYRLVKTAADFFLERRFSSPKNNIFSSVRFPNLSSINRRSLGDGLEVLSCFSRLKPLTLCGRGKQSMNDETSGFK
jgi:hypothetical protein